MLEIIDKRVDAASVRISGGDLAALTSAQDFRKARLAFQKRDRGAAIPQLQRIAARGTANEHYAENGIRALVMLGQVYSELGQWREAAQAYDDACQRNPRLAQIRLAASQAWLAAGRNESAAERAEQSLSLSDSTEAWFALAVALYRIQMEQPEVARDWNKFDLTLAQLQKRSQASPLAEPWRVDLLTADTVLVRQAETSPSESLQRVQTILTDLEARYPSETQLWTRLPLVWQRLMRPADADRCVGHLQKLPGGTLLASHTKVRLLRARGEHQQADELLASLVGNSPVTERKGLVRDWVNLKLAQQDYDGARQLLVREHEAQPDDLSTLLLLAELDVQRRRWSEAQQWEAKLNKLPHPAGLHSRVLSVRRLLANSKGISDASFMRAANELQRLREQAPSWPEVAVLAGQVAQRRNDLEEAAAQYGHAVELGARQLPVFENLIAVLERLERYTEAQRYLQQLESQVPLNQNLTVLQGTVEMRLDQPERALAMARQAVEKRPNEIEARLWLARLLVMHSKPAEAETELNQALLQAPTDMRVWSALQLFHLRSKNTEAALQMALQIQQKSDLPEAERYFVAAQTFELAGKRDLAEQSFNQAVLADPKNAAILFRMAEFYLKFDSLKAETCLERTIELDPQHRRARRTLATLLASRGSDEDWARAGSLLAVNAKDSPDAAGDNRLLAVLLLQRGGGGNVEKATTLLQQLVSNQTQSRPVDRLLLAQAFERQALALIDAGAKTKKLEQSRLELEALVNRSQPDWAHFVAIIEFSERHQQMDEVSRWLASFEDSLTDHKKPTAAAIAQLVRLQIKHQAGKRSGPWLDRLEALPDDPLTALLRRAQWCQAQGLEAEIEQRIDAQGERLLAAETDAAVQSRITAAIASIYQEVRQLEGAERWQRRLFASNPQRYDGLAAVLTQQGRWSEAVELCRQAAESDKSARPALVALACLSSSEVTDERVADCEPLIQAALRGNRQHADLHYSLGVVRVIQERTADAIAEFRQVVKINPRHVPAMNNLALLLAEDKAQQAEAIRVIDRAIDQAGLTADLLDTKGTILLLAGRAAEAVRLLEMATQGRNVDPRFEFHLALAYFDQGQLEKAGVRFEQAMAGGLEKQILTRWDQQQLDQLRRKLNVNSRTPSPAVASE